MINPILRQTRKLFNFLPPYQGDQYFVTIKELNDVIAQLNNIQPYRSHDVTLTQSGTTAPVATKLASGAKECTSNCNCSNTTCDCSSPCGNERAGIFSTAFTYTSAGVYNLRVTVDPTVYPKSIKDLGLYFSPLSNTAHTIVATQGETTAHVINYTIRTYNSGVAANGILNDTKLLMRLYF